MAKGMMGKTHRMTDGKMMTEGQMRREMGKGKAGSKARPMKKGKYAKGKRG